MFWRTDESNARKKQMITNIYESKDTHKSLTTKEKNKKNATFTKVADFQILSKLQISNFILKGEDLKRGRKQARKKYIGQAVGVYLANGNPDSKLRDKYWDTYHCQDVVVLKDNKRKTTYCNNRWCPTCASIRTAILISGYNPQLMKFTDPQFVTLTCDDKHVKDLATLTAEIDRKYAIWRRITKNANKQHIHLNGIRNIEITYNEVGKWYHSHLHIVVDGKAQADFIVAQWIAINAKLGVVAQPYCQKVLQVDKSREMPFIELFKYVSKIGGKNKQGKRELFPYTPQVYDTIFQSLYKKRTLQPFGNVHKVIDEIPEVELTSELYDLAEEVYCMWYGHDWVNKETGELLTGYEPSPEILSLIESKGIKLEGIKYDTDVLQT